MHCSPCQNKSLQVGLCLGYTYRRNLIQSNKIWKSEIDSHCESGTQKSNLDIHDDIKCFKRIQLYDFNIIVFIVCPFAFFLHLPLTLCLVGALISGLLSPFSMLITLLMNKTATVIFLSFRTDSSGQTVYTVCNSFCIFWMHYCKETPSCSTFRVITTNVLGVWIFRELYGSYPDDLRSKFVTWIMVALSLAVPYYCDTSWSSCEPRHDKTNKMTVRPAKTQISLGIRPVWSVFAVRSMGS